MRIVLLWLISFLVIPGGLEAQISTAGIGGAPQIELQPAFPNPYSTVTASLNDYASVAPSGVISWRINGVAQKSLENQRNVELTVGAPGKAFTVEAVINSGSGSYVAAKKIITPTYLDLIVEPQTRTPQFYQGRALPSVGSTVNLTALVNAGSQPKESLVYTWNVNGTVLLGGPIRGQNQVSVTMPQGGAIVTVTIERSTGGVVGSKTVQLLNSLPLLKFYTVNSLYGVSKLPIKNTLALVGNSTNVRAEPFFLDTRTFNNPDLLQWTIGTDQVQGTANNPYEINLVRQGGGNPTPVGFHVRNLTQVLQGVESGFTVQ